MQACGPSGHHITDEQAQRANRGDWDRTADDYQAEHGGFLGDIGFIWCPEGLDEAEACLLGDVSGARVLEVGCGAAQCSRWLITRGADVVAFDLSFQQLHHARRLDQDTSIDVPVVCAAVAQIPFSDATFDVACSAFGALPFVIDVAHSLREVARVLRPGARFVFSVVHPVRRMFADDPTEAGLVVTRSYFDRTPYVETSADGTVTYVEPHHLLGDWVAALHAADLTIQDLIEPSWPPGHQREWGGWGPLRGAVMPGTAIFVTRKCLPS